MGKGKVKEKLQTDRYLKQSIVETVKKASQLKNPNITLICTANCSNKFYQIRLHNNTVIEVCYGKIGAAGNLALKEWYTPGKAPKEYHRLIVAKKAKGYEDPYEDPYEKEEGLIKIKTELVAIKAIKHKIDTAAKEKFDAFLNLLK
jgi:predicted DNA-binding WGR domain protein